MYGDFLSSQGVEERSILHSSDSLGESLGISGFSVYPLSRSEARSILS